MNIVFKQIVGAALCAAAAAAPAGVVSYDTRAGFDAALSASATDTFDNLAPGQQPGPLPRGSGAGAYRAAVLDSGGAGAGGSDFYALDAGAGNRWLSTAVAGSTLVFSGFDPQVRGIGGNFFGTGVDGLLAPGSALLLTLTDLAGSTDYALDAVATGGGFFGLVSGTSIVSLSVRAVQPASADPGDPYSYRYATVDNLAVGPAAAAVPEPGTLAIALLALAALGGARRRGPGG